MTKDHFDIFLVLFSHRLGILASESGSFDKMQTPSSHDLVIDSPKQPIRGCKARQCYKRLTNYKCDGRVSIDHMGATLWMGTLCTALQLATLLTV